MPTRTRKKPTKTSSVKPKTQKGQHQQAQPLVEGVKKDDSSPAFPSKPFMEWLNEIKNLMFLTNYEVYVSTEPCSPDSDAEMTLDEYRRIRLSFPPNFTSLPRERQRAAVVHEFAHVPIKIAKRPYESFESTVSSESWSVVDNMGNDAEENAVTILEWTIAPHMPLPPEK